MLKAYVDRSVRADIKHCVNCVADAESFMSQSRYTYTVKKISDNVYEVVFRWKKMGITRFYRVRIRVRRVGENTIVYESVEGSDYWFQMVFRFENSDGSTRVRVESKMRAGLMADILGRRDYQSFVEELVDKGIKSFLEKMARDMIRPTPQAVNPSCTRCTLYDESRHYCYYLERTVEDPDKPPCNGKAFIPYTG